MINCALSVIIPVYNSENFLEHCLDSVLSQGIDKMEILIVNDGSTDNSQIIIDEYKNKYPCIKSYISNNQGVALARNLALKNASGKYVIFCDSDDFVPKNAYKKMLSLALNKQVDIVTGAYRNVDVRDNNVSYLNCKRNNTSKFTTYFFCPCMWNKMILSSLIKDNKILFKEVKVGEDIIFLSELYVHVKNIAYISYPIYHYNNYEVSNYVSLNHKYNYEYFKHHINCREKLKENLLSVQPLEVKKMVYEEMTPFLLNFFLRTYDDNERSLIFNDIQNFLLEYKSEFPNSSFHSIFSLDKDVFFSCTPQNYVQTIQVDAKEKVVYQFKNGSIGLIYVFKYIKYWLQFKINKIFKNRSKL